MVDTLLNGNVALICQPIRLRRIGRLLTQRPHAPLLARKHLDAQRAYDTLTKISEGQGAPGDIDQLLMLCDGLVKMSNCGLGQTAAVPIKDILKHFRAEVDAHINLKVCPAGVCSMVVEETIPV